MTQDPERIYRCISLLPDEATICWKELSFPETRCSAHKEEFIRLSRDCTALGDKVDALKDELGTIHSPEGISNLKTAEEARDALARVDAVLQAMTSEIAARKSQHIRYCGNGRSQSL